MSMSRSFAGEYARLLREVEAMHEAIKVLMAETQRLAQEINLMKAKPDANQQRRTPGRD